MTRPSRGRGAPSTCPAPRPAGPRPAPARQLNSELQSCSVLLLRLRRVLSLSWRSVRWGAQGQATGLGETQPRRWPGGPQSLCPAQPGFPPAHNAGWTAGRGVRATLHPGSGHPQHCPDPRGDWGALPSCPKGAAPASRFRPLPGSLEPPTCRVEGSQLGAALGHVPWACSGWLVP